MRSKRDEGKEGGKGVYRSGTHPGLTLAAVLLRSGRYTESRRNTGATSTIKWGITAFDALSSQTSVRPRDLRRGRERRVLHSNAANYSAVVSETSVRPPD